MSTKTVEDLREHLFATIAALRDKENPMDIDRARAVSEVANTIIRSAKVEVEFLRLTGGEQSAFIGSVDKGGPGAPALPSGITGVTRHLIK